MPHYLRLIWGHLVTQCKISDVKIFNGYFSFDLIKSKLYKYCSSGDGRILPIILRDFDILCNVKEV